ncbi:MAG: CHASE2 domain-containing protein [Cyanothece sp. SIO2G6]|nr:CHASE2 domain-containing protein [Cyanothece sp. SIO2G6]
MGHVVTIKLTGNLNQHGFQVLLDIAQEGQSPLLSEDGMLPANSELARSLEQWQYQYDQWLRPQSVEPHRSLKPYKIKYDGPLKSLDDCREAAQQLARAFRKWLQSSSFRDLERHLCRMLAVDDGIRIIIRSDDPYIHALPWHLWSFVEDYPKAEVALGAPRFQQTLNQAIASTLTSRVSILVVLGDRTNIDIDTDYQLLAQQPEADVTLLLEPTPSELAEHLYTRAWDILFFAGHSDTLAVGDGVLQLNANTTLTIEELKYGMKKAIANGLQLAIFNSCNGLGLAHDLAELQLPQMIVMRQAIPDQVAHQFLKYFLDAFAQGMSLYQAQRQAREQLQSLEQKFPCASWLPIIYQHPAKIPPSWHTLQQLSHPIPRPSPGPSLPLTRSTRWSGLIMIAIVSILLTSLLVGVRSLGLLQPSELHAFDQFVKLRANPYPDERIVVITIDSEDMAYQDRYNFGRRDGWSLSEQALGQLLQWFKSHPPRVIGLDMFHPFAFDQTMMDDLNAVNMVAVCEVGTAETPIENKTPPPGFEGKRLGFADFVMDYDGIIRRQLLLMAPGEMCQTSRAFSLQLTHRYLAAEGIEPIESSPNGDRYLAGKRFNRLQYNAGGYQLPAYDTNGYQILLNDRYSDPLTIPLRELLDENLDAQWARLLHDRIVMIGGDQPQQDRHQTARHSSTPGVILHAHMVSQLLDITLDGKSQLWWWPQWGEALWITLWAMVGGGLGWWVRSPWKLGFATAGTVLTIYGLCWLIFIQDGWVPLVPPIIALCITALAVKGILTTFKFS